MAQGHRGGKMISVELKDMLCPPGRELMEYRLNGSK